MFMPGVWFLWSKKNIVIFQKEKGNTFTLLITKSLQKDFKKSKIAQIYYYDPQSAQINVQSPQSESTPSCLILINLLTLLQQDQLRLIALIVQSKAEQSRPERVSAPQSTAVTVALL